MTDNDDDIDLNTTEEETLDKEIIEDIKLTIQENITSNEFTYDDNPMHVITDEDKKIWFKCKDIAIILGYANTRNPMGKNVDPKYKKTYGNIIKKKLNRRRSTKYLRTKVPIKIPIKTRSTKKHDNSSPPENAQKHEDYQTMFIDHAGLIEFLKGKANIKNPAAKKLCEYISNEILPELLKRETYTVSTTESEIQKLNKSFYDDNMLSDYDDKSVIYLAYIGKHKGKHVLKFGLSDNFARRDIKEHRKTYKIFNVIKIWETAAQKKVETKIKENFLQARKC